MESINKMMRRSFASRIVGIHRSFCSGTNEEILMQKHQNIAVITLNNPKVLNSLNLNMIQILREKAKDLNQDTLMKAVIMKGAGPKAFCAGGDVKTIYENVKNNEFEKALAFFTTEYKCDYEIASMKPVQISIYNGIVMGGGVGVSIFSPIKIACESSVFAMPESKIGLFTDVGASYFLPRLRSSIGYYLGLTSRRLKGKELVTAGVATHFVPKSSLEELELSLIKGISKNSNKEDILKIIENFTEEVPNKLDDEDKISKFFNGDTFEEIYHRIHKSDDDFALALINDLKTASPLSMRIIFEMLKKGSKMELKECFQMDCNIATNLKEGLEFVEGVRALLIDKDLKPDWKYKDPLQIPEEYIKSFFNETGIKLF